MKADYGNFSRFARRRQFCPFFSFFIFSCLAARISKTFLASPRLASHCDSFFLFFRLGRIGSEDSTSCREIERSDSVVGVDKCARLAAAVMRARRTCACVDIYYVYIMNILWAK